MDKDEKIKEILAELQSTKQELQATKEHLNQYTASSYSKEYYEKNKDTIKERNANYKKNTNYKYDPTPEKKKEYARRAYLKRKENLQKVMEEKQNTDNI